MLSTVNLAMFMSVASVIWLRLLITVVPQSAADPFER